MGLRGPIPKNPPPKPGPIIQESIAPPASLCTEEVAIFRQLVEDNRAAGVPMRQADAALYADLASATYRRESAADDRVWLALTRQMEELRGQLCIGPRSRGRAGIRDVEKPVAKTALAKVLELAKTKRQ
jgi:hypothetical protein